MMLANSQLKQAVCVGPARPSKLSLPKSSRAPVCTRGVIRPRAVRGGEPTSIAERVILTFTAMEMSWSILGNAPNVWVLGRPWNKGIVAHLYSLCAIEASNAFTVF